MQRAIRQLKTARSPEQRFIAELTALKDNDSASYERTRAALLAYLAP